MEVVQDDRDYAAGSSTTSIRSNFHGLANMEVETTDSLTPVAGHVCVQYRGCLLCWGGYCYDEREIHYRECNWLYIYPFMFCGARNNIWLKVQCETELQLRPNSGSTAGIHNNVLYIFGGCLFDDLHRRMVNTSMLIAIDLHNGRLSAKRYPAGGKIPTPRDKTTSWIVDDKFYIFGGYGMAWHRLDHTNCVYFFRAENFLDDDMGSCWNNQLLYYDLAEESWHEPESGGNRPSQRAAAASAYLARSNVVFLFGGRHDTTRLNDLYVLDLANNIWAQIDPPTSDIPLSPDILPSVPEGRSWCAFSLLPEQRKIICYGGLCPRGQPLGDLWELDIAPYCDRAGRSVTSLISEMKARQRWRLISPVDHRLPSRLWHCAVLMGNGQRQEAVLFYGGMNEAPSRDSPFVRTLLVHRLRPPTLRQMALQALVEQILHQWGEELSREAKPIYRLHPGGTGNQSHSAEEGHLDLLTFASSTGYFARLPKSLHSSLRALLSIRRHAKPLGGTTPHRGNSPMRWQPSPVPVNFHLLHLDGMMDQDREDDDAFRRRNAHRRVPLSPKSQRRALADELLLQISENARSKGVPFLHALFNTFDCL